MSNNKILINITEQNTQSRKRQSHSIMNLKRFMLNKFSASIEFTQVMLLFLCNSEKSIDNIVANIGPSVIVICRVAKKQI